MGQRYSPKTQRVSNENRTNIMNDEERINELEGMLETANLKVKAFKDLWKDEMRLFREYKEAERIRNVDGRRK